MQTRFQRRWSAYGFTRWLCLLLLGAGGLLHARADPGGFIRLLSPGDQIPPGPGVDWGSVEFRWEAVSWAASYKLTLHQLETGQAVEYPVEGAPTSFTVSLTSGTSYFWQLTAYTGAGQTGTAVGSQAEYFRAGFELGKCDLYVRALDLPPDPVVAGQNLSVLYHVRNAGAGNSVATKVLLQIERADGSIYLQKEADLPAMAAVSFDFAFETVFLIPADVPTGTYSVRVLLDTPDLNRETDKDNNTYFAANALKLQAITANLTPYQSAGWDDKLVLAKTKGATRDAVGLLSTDPLYLNWSVINNGQTETRSAFITELTIDGNLINYWTTQPPVDLGPEAAISVRDIALGKLSPGQHTFRLRVDRDNSVEESDESESDNEYTRTVTILPGSFRVTAAGGTGGTLAPAGGLTVLDGDTVPFTATPDEGWLVDHWLVDGVPQQTGGNTYTLPAVRADHTVAVTFLIQTYRVILSLPGGGTVSQLPGLDAIPYGTEVSLTATPSPGFRFYDWRGDLSGVGETLRFRITNDVSVEAFFQPVPVASVLRVTDFMRPFGFTIALPQQPEMLHVLQNSSDLAPWSDLTAFDGSVATNFFVFISDTGRRRVFYRCTDVQKITTPPFLTFPLTNRATGHSWTSQSTPVSALFDHYGGANERDGIIATYAGEMVVLGEGNGFRRDGLTTVVPVSPDPGGDYYQKYPVIGIRRDGSQKLPLIFAYDDPDDIFWEDGHPGYDYAVGADEDVVAAAEGDVVPSESTACDGTVCLDHGNGYRTYYRHLSSRSPKLEVNGVIQAIHVKAGELVGHPGSTSCDGPVAVHLHFEVRRNLDNAWLPVDPYGRSCLDGSSIEPSLWLKGN